MRTRQTEGAGLRFSPCTTIHWHWPRRHIKHPAFMRKKRKEKKEKKKKRNLLTRAASPANRSTAGCAQHVDPSRRRTDLKKGGKWPKVRGKQEVWRMRNSYLTPTRPSWTSRISRRLLAPSVTSSTPKTPTWSRSTLFWKTCKCCWRLPGFLRAPTGRTEVSLFVLRLILSLLATCASDFQENKTSLSTDSDNKGPSSFN